MALIGGRPYNPLGNEQNNTACTGINGVPLGGLGAGCVELIPDGRLGNFCTNNNRHRNERIETLPGTFFAFAASDGVSNTAMLLQTASTLPLGQTGSRFLLPDGAIAYDGLYPRADLTYATNLHIGVSLHATGTVLPGDLAATSMPAALFTFTVTNAGDRDGWASVLFSWENIAGCLHGVFPDGRDDLRAIRDDGRLVGIECRAPEGCRPNQRGSHALYVDAPAEAVVTAVRYNTWEISNVLCRLEDDGAFSDADWDPIFFSESRFTAGLACKVPLAAGESREITFALAWWYPEYRVAESEMVGRDAGVCDQGHAYAAYFADVHDVARTALARRKELRAGIARWHDAVLGSSLPDWLGRMLLNSLYVLTPGTLWAKDGRFSLMETPYGPMMGTLDQRFYASIGTALFFPELERSELSLFAITQHPEDRGRVYHDLGNLRFDDPKTGTTAKKWTDLNPKFVLMAYRNYLWMNDRAELERLWPYMVDMMAYTLSQDTDGDGLPNNDDRSTTYDDWAFFGANSYAASLWVAALAAFRRMAGLLGREADWAPYAATYDLAVREFDARLWDAGLGYYRLYNDDRNPVFAADYAAVAAEAVSSANGAVDQGAVPSIAMADHPQVNDDCHDGQLAGQWYADLLGLGTLFPEAHIRSAVRAIYRHNATPRGVRKGVSPNGAESPNPPSSRWWSEAGQGWPGYEVGHYAALAIYQGETADALTTVERVHREITAAGLTWNQPLRWNVQDSNTYGWGCDRYMNSPAVWFVYLALAGMVLNRPERTLALRPRLLPGTTVLAVPLFTPGNWGRLRVADTADAREMLLAFDAPEPLDTLRVPATFPTVTVDGATPLSVATDTYGSTPEHVITFPAGTTVGPAGITIKLT
jgi:non-lysosomal glucosylceramidase